MKAAKRVAGILARLLIAAGLAFGFAAALWGPSRVVGWLAGHASPETAEAQEVRFYTVRHQELVLSLNERGTLRATRNVKISVPFGSRRSQATIAWLRPQDDVVEEGELIIQFEKEGFEDAKLRAEEQLIEQEKKREIAALNIDIEESARKAVVASAETRLRDAEESLRRYREEDAPNKLRSLIDAKRAAVEDLEQKRKEYTDIQREADEQLMGDEAAQEKARADVARALRAVETAEKAYDDASLSQKKFRSYEYPETLAKRAEAVTNAALDRDRTTVNAVNRVDNQRTEVRTLDQQIERTKQTIDEQTEMIALADVNAPVGGRLLYGDTDRGRPAPEDIKVGMQCWGGMNLMTIPDESVFEIDIYIAEEYRYRIAKGARAQVTIEAIPGMNIEGVVGTLENFAKTPPGGGPKKYRAAIAIDKADDRLASGMTADVEIVAETVARALVVPIEAVYNIESITVCFVQGDDGQLERREVVTGKSNDHYVQIVEGLQVGERVALTQPAEVSRRQEEAAEEGETEPEAAPAGTEDDVEPPERRGGGMPGPAQAGGAGGGRTGAGRRGGGGAQGGGREE